MSLTGVKTLPLLRGTLASLGPWQALLGRSGLRVYPYQLGCAVRAGSSGTTIDTSGMGEFAANNYLIDCTATAYGNTNLYVPNTNKISRVSSIGVADDELVISPAITVAQYDYLLNIGNDGAVAPLVTPNYDGTTLSLFDDPTGQSAHSTKYVLTGINGQFEIWLGSGTLACDLLITDTTPSVIAVIPMVMPGREIV